METDDLPVTTVRELSHPIGLSLCETLPLSNAERLLSKTGTDYVVIRNLSDQPIGVITERDITKLTLARPERWASPRCACAVQQQPALRADAGLNDVIELFLHEHEEIRPLLVHESHGVLGVLRPTEVFQWCAEHRPDALDALAVHAQHQPSHG